MGRRPVFRIQKHPHIPERRPGEQQSTNEVDYIPTSNNIYVLFESDHAIVKLRARIHG